MSKQFRVATDPDTLKPIIEAMIFASEEPLSARALIRLLAGDRDDEKDAEPQPGETTEDIATAAGMVEEADVQTNVVNEASVETVAEMVEVVDIEDEEEIAPISGGLPANEELLSADDLSLLELPAPDPDRVAPDGQADEPASEEIASDEQPVAAEVPEADGESAGEGGEEAAGEPAAAEREEVAEEGATTEEQIELDLGLLPITGDAGDLADAMERAEARSAQRRTPPAIIDQNYIRALVVELNEEYLDTGRAFRIVEVAGGFQFATIRDYGEFVALLSKDKLRRRLSPAALETLSIIAYRQPVSKPEVESIRGVNCDQVLVNLMEKNLVSITGRSEAVGRPLLYGTTDDFLRCFGLKTLSDLPKLREIEELMEEDAYSAEKAEVITVDANTDVEEIEARVGAAGHHDEHAASEGAHEEQMELLSDEALEQAGAGNPDGGVEGNDDEPGDDDQIDEDIQDEEMDDDDDDEVSGDGEEDPEEPADDADAIGEADVEELDSEMMEEDDEEIGEMDDEELVDEEEEEADDDDEHDEAVEAIGDEVIGDDDTHTGDEADERGEGAMGMEDAGEGENTDPVQHDMRTL